MLDLLFYLLCLSAGVTLVILLTGVLSFARGGGFHSRHANRLMRYRLAAQVVTLALFICYALLNAARG